MPFVQHYYDTLEILEIMKCLKFHLKSERKRNLEKNKFCLACLLWNLFLENFQKAYNSYVNKNIDELLLPRTASCKFTKYVPNKQDKFGIKFWMAVDVESKYLYNGFFLSWEGLDEKWRCQLANRYGNKANNSFIQAKFQCHVW